MRTLSLSEAKMKLSALVERVIKTDAEIVITRNGSPAAVLISPDEYESLQETKLILSDRDFHAEIKMGLRDIKKKKTKLYTLEELFA